MVSQGPDLLRDTLLQFRQLSNHMRLCLQMNLLDRAIKLAAEQDEPEEMNFVRKHARQQVGRCAWHFMLAATPAMSLSRQAPAAEYFAPPLHLHHSSPGAAAHAMSCPRLQCALPAQRPCTHKLQLAQAEELGT